MLIYDTSSDSFKYYDGSSWENMGGNSSLSWSAITGKPSGFADNIDNVGSSPWNQTGSNLLQYGNANQGKIGIGTEIPKVSIHTYGSIIIGSEKGGATQGQIRFNNVTKDFEGYNGTNWLSLTGLPSPEPPPSYEVGDYVEGGVIFWVSPDGTMVKVVHPNEFQVMAWSNVINSLAGANSSSNGISNSNAIVQQLGHTASLAQFCLDLVSGDYDDWYLPSNNEALALYQNRVVVNQTLQSWLQDEIEFGFYTSTEATAFNANIMSSQGNIVTWSKNLSPPGGPRVIRTALLD